MCECIEDIDRECDDCQEPLCDDCDCGTIHDERSLCGSCKDGSMEQHYYPPTLETITKLKHTRKLKKRKRILENYEKTKRKYIV